MKKIISILLATILMLSLTAFAADFILISSTVNDSATDVYVKEGKISFNFSDDVKVVTVQAPFEPGQAPYDITILDANVLVYEKDTLLVDGTDYTITFNQSTFDINFTNDLQYSTSYLIDFSTVKSSSGVELTGTKKTLSFTTEAEPDINVEGIAITNGVGSSVITEEAQPEGDDTRTITTGSVYGFNVSLKNIASEAKTVNVVCAIYNDKGIIKRVFSSEKSIDATATEMVELGTYIDASYAGGVAKIYIWDNLSNKTPFVGSREFNISSN